LLSAGINVPGRFLAEAADYKKSFVKHNISHFSNQELFQRVTSQRTLPAGKNTEELVVMAKREEENVICKKTDCFLRNY
jgi:hypothetical protein